MLANFFNKTKPINYIIIFGILSFYFSFFFLKSSLTFNDLGTFLVIVFSLLTTIFIVSKNNLTFDNSYAALFFAIFFGLCFIDLQFDFTIILNLFFLFSIRKILSLKSKKNYFQKLFDAGFWIGVSFILSKFSIFLLPLIFLGVFLHNKINFQAIIIPLTGFITPIFLWQTYLFLTDKDYLLNNLFSNELSFSTISINYFNTTITITVAIVYILKLASLFNIKNSFKKSWILIGVYAIFCALGIVFFKDSSSKIIFLFFPSSVILTNGFEFIKHKKIANFLLAILLLLPVFFAFL